VLIVCEREDVYASGCAVGRCFPTYSKKTKNPPTKEDVNVEFLVVEGERTVGLDLEEKERILLQDSCTAIQLTARLLDAPCNEMNTMHFLDEILKVEKELKAFGVTSTVIKGEELRERGFGGVYGVGRAAENPPVLAILSFKPKKPQRTVAWVGKGIVYDTGGLSIKSKTMMPGMKADCGGAAAILGAFSVAVKSGFQDTLHGIFCLAENSVGPLATRPDDIHTLYSGKTVEINNTDAEGRLVLADGVVYASRDLKADVIVDMATLTGAQGIATGQYHASHLTNSEEWEIKTAVAGRSSGDLSFPAVYCPEFQFPEFKSEVADMKNSVKDRSNAQPSCAGLFINAHLGFDFPGTWLHIDMAFPSSSGERGTGYGVALLNCLFGASSESKMLQALAPENSATNGEASPNKPKKMRLN
jgi:probable aminopeptidase NPEPL1